MYIFERQKKILINPEKVKSIPVVASSVRNFANAFSKKADKILTVGTMFANGPLNRPPGNYGTFTLYAYPVGSVKLGVGLL
jgi:hypothetical protein